MRRTAEEAARTRTALIDAALLVFAEVGVAEARLADIAARAGATRGAVYHHFEDKTALYAAVLGECWDTVTAPIWAVLEDDGLTAFLAAWLRYLRENERFRALLTVTIGGGPALTDYGDDKAWGLADWRSRLASYAPEHAAHLLSWLCGTAVLAAADPGLLPHEPPLLKGMPE